MFFPMILSAPPLYSDQKPRDLIYIYIYLVHLHLHNSMFALMIDKKKNVVFCLMDDVKD